MPLQSPCSKKSTRDTTRVTGAFCVSCRICRVLALLLFLLSTHQGALQGLSASSVARSWARRGSTSPSNSRACKPILRLCGALALLMQRQRLRGGKFALTDDVRHLLRKPSNVAPLEPDGYVTSAKGLVPIFSQTESVRKTRCNSDKTWYSL